MRLINKTPRTGCPEDKIHVDFKIRGHLGGIRYPCMADIKYDGINVTLISDKSIWFTTSKFTRTVSNSCLPEVADGIYLAEWVHGQGLWESLHETTDKNIDGCKLIVFDVLALGGHNVSGKDFMTRRELLIQNIKIPSCLPTSILCESKEQLDIWYRSAVDSRHEGVVVKNMNESFIGQRWVKMKPAERMSHGTTSNGE